MTERWNRRDFLRWAGAGAVGAAVGSRWPAWGAEAPPAPGCAMPSRPLGRTGFDVKLFSLGGQATLEQDGRSDASEAIIHRAIDLGVNYLDTAPYYGPSQDFFGNVLKTRRREVFLATKTHDRSRDGSWRLLEDSLKRLRTETIDLWQLHNMRTTGDLDRIFGKHGAIHALTEAREQGLVRFLGITGHRNPHVLADGLKRFDFDCVLMALNAADRHRLSFIEHCLPVAVEKKMGIIGMKVPARGRIFREGGVTTMKQAVDYVWSLPVSTIIVGCDTIAQLEENVRLACEFAPMSEGALRRTEALTESYADHVCWYKESARS